MIVDDSLLSGHSSEYNTIKDNIQYKMHKKTSMKVAIITDTITYGARKGSKFLHDYFEKFYDDVFFPT